MSSDTGETGSGCRVLLAEDDRIVRLTVRDALLEAGFDVVACADGGNAARVIDSESIDILLSDVRLPGEDGVSLFRRLRLHQPAAAAILMTAYGEFEDAVDVIREGAHDYITKPFEIDTLILRLCRIRDELAFRRKAESSPCRDNEDRRLRKEISGSAPATRRVLELIDACAHTDVNVLITGETGTGKELCARMIHCRGARCNRPLVTLNCAAIPEQLLESELFGHEKGAFTGAQNRLQGCFKAADGGTLFLDEIGAMPLSQQAKLLRTVETGSFKPVGSDKTSFVKVRIISATNEDLFTAVEDHRFREDLLYRLNVINVQMPSLRKRRADIPLLVRDFLREIGDRLGVEPPSLEADAVAALDTYSYPGNVRELIHALEHAVALSRGAPISLGHLPPAFAGSLGPAPEAAGLDIEATGLEPLSSAIRRFEATYIQRVLDAANGSRVRAAKILGISRKSLWQKIRDR